MGNCISRTKTLDTRRLAAPAAKDAPEGTRAPGLLTNARARQGSDSLERLRRSGQSGAFDRGTCHIDKLPFEILINVTGRLERKHLPNLRGVSDRMRVAAEASTHVREIRSADELKVIKRWGTVGWHTLVLTETIAYDPNQRAAWQTTHTYPHFDDDAFEALPEGVHRLELRKVEAIGSEGLRHIANSSVIMFRWEALRRPARVATNVFDDDEWAFLRDDYDENLVFPSDGPEEWVPAPLSIDGAKVLGDSGKFTVLELINADIGDRGLHEVLRNRGLTKLYVPGNGVTFEGLKDLKGMDTLKDIDLSDNPIGDKGIEVVAGLPALSRALLRGCRIGSEGARALRAMDQLELVDLSNNPIGDEGAEAVANLPSISSASMGNCGISDEGVRKLAQKVTLTSVDLMGNRMITDEGAKALAENDSIRVLALHGCGIGDEGARALVAKALEANSSLKTLYLFDNERVSMPARRELRGRVDAELAQKTPEEREKFNIYT
jgi:Leucine Rich repeat